MVFNIDKDVDEYFTLTLLIFFLIGYIINIHANGIATLVYLEDEYGIPQEYAITDKQRILNKYSQDIVVRNARARKILFWLYYGAWPLINIYYIQYWLRNNYIRVRPRDVSRRIEELKRMWRKSVYNRVA